MTSILRDTDETAARERLKLEAVAGRSRVTALAHRIPGVARRLGSEDAARSGLRYQPVAWTVIVVAAVAFWFPGRSDSESTPMAAPGAAFVPATTTTVAPADATPPTTAPMPAVALPRPVATPSPAVTTTVVAAPAPSSSPPPASPAPLTVRGFGWAAALSGSGLSTADVPEGTMPVANRLGQLDKASFVRLDGDATSLVLVEDSEGAREAVGAGVVAICPITDAGWQEAPDQSFDDAPAWDASACVTGTESEDTWTFDLSRFSARDADTGFALVPDAAAPADFQITLLPS